MYNADLGISEKAEDDKGLSFSYYVLSLGFWAAWKLLFLLVCCTRVRSMTKMMFSAWITLYFFNKPQTLIYEVFVLVSLDHCNDDGVYNQTSTLKEYVEKLDILKSPEERLRRMHEIPEVHADPNMDPKAQIW